MKIVAAFALLLLGGAAPDPEVLPLWPGAAPGDAGIPGEEKFFEYKVGGKIYEVGGRPTIWKTNVSKPAILVYPAPKDRNTGVSMLIAPGGGYHNLGWDIEGEEIAAWLNSVGITGILLKYRCPRRPGDVKGVPPAGPLKDAQRAVSLVRSRAAAWGLDPAKIGIVGFSAGGHLAGATATNFETRTYDAVDDADKVSCRPDFAVMLYSGYFGLNGALSPTIKTPAGIPPLFIAHATDDPISDVDTSVTMYTAMRKAGAPVELHVYATGGHGWGVRKVGHPCEGWTESCLAWLRKGGLLK